MALPFGKFKGLQLSQVPNDYVLWLAGFGRSLQKLAQKVYLCDCNLCSQFVANSNSESEEEVFNTLNQCFEQGIVPLCIHTEEEQIWWKTWMLHRDWIYKARDEFKARYICRICLKRLVPIGTSRYNGRSHGDWEGRITHKQCWRREQIYPDDD